MLRLSVVQASKQAGYWRTGVAVPMYAQPVQTNRSGSPFDYQFAALARLRDMVARHMVLTPIDQLAKERLSVGCGFGRGNPT